MITVNVVFMGNIIYSKSLKNQPVGDALAIILNDMSSICSSSLGEIYDNRYRGHTYILDQYVTLSSWLINVTKPMISLVKKVHIGRRKKYVREHANIFGKLWLLLSDFICSDVNNPTKNDRCRALNIYAKLDHFWQCGSIEHMKAFLYYHEHCNRVNYELLKPIIISNSIVKLRYNRVYLDRFVSDWIYVGWWRKMCVFASFMKTRCHQLPEDIINYIVSMIKRLYSINFIELAIDK